MQPESIGMSGENPSATMGWATRGCRLRASKIGTDIPDTAFLLPSSVICASRTIEHGAQQIQRQGANAPSFLVSQIFEKEAAVVVVTLLETEPTIAGERAPEIAEEENGVREFQITRRLLWTAMRSAGQQAIDDIAAGRSGQDQKELGFPLAFQCPVVAIVAEYLTRRYARG